MPNPIKTTALFVVIFFVVFISGFCRGVVHAQKSLYRIEVQSENAIQAAPVVSTDSQSLQSGEQRLFVVMKSKLTSQKVLSMMKKEKNLKFEGGIANSDAVVMTVSGDLSVALSNIKSNPDVAMAIPMPKVHAMKTTDDTYFSSLWGLGKMNVQQAWDAFSDVSASTSEVKVAVVDSGVDKTHPDLVGKIAQGDWIKCTKTTCNPDESGTDSAGHGTHVAGTIAAVANNGKGIAGVGWGVKIMAVQVLESNGDGDLDMVLNGISYAADHGAKVINMSLGIIEDQLGSNDTEKSQTKAKIQQIIDHAWESGAVLVAAAGNCGKNDNNGYDDCKSIDGATYVSNPKSYPGASNHVIAVAATNINNQKANYSEYNQASLSCQPNDSRDGCWVSVAAPGGESSSGCNPSVDGANCIISTLPGGAYGYGSGTSMASPHVAGVAALILSKNKNLTNSQVKDIIERKANKTILAGVTKNGLVDANASVLEAGSNITDVPVASFTPTVTGTSSITTTISPSVTGSVTPSPSTASVVSMTPTQPVLSITPTIAVSPSNTPTPRPTATPTITPFPLDPPRFPKTEPSPYPIGPYCPDIK